MTNGKTVLITGASSGIGLELAKIFARNSYNLALVARDKDRLSAVARTLEKDGATVWFMAIDLSHPSAPQEIYRKLTSDGVAVDILVNNAGFASYGSFVETDLQEEMAELAVNIGALTHLTKLCARDMVSRGHGRILNVASTAAFIPGPLMAVYYASKAYVLSFSEALAEEMRGTGVSVSVLCPGPTDTGFKKRAHLEGSRLFEGKKMRATDVARIAYEGLMKGKTLIIPGLANRVLIQSARFAPRALTPRVARWFMERRH